MPSKGYSTIGLKPAVLSRLQNITDEYYPGMFLPSTLIIMMNEIKRGYYEVGAHNIKLDSSGQYTSLTIRSDVKMWLEDNYKKMGEDYGGKYRINSFTQFACVFMLNVLNQNLLRRIIMISNYNSQTFIGLKMNTKKEEATTI